MNLGGFLGPEGLGFLSILALAFGLLGGMLIGVLIWGTGLRKDLAVCKRVLRGIASGNLEKMIGEYLEEREHLFEMMGELERAISRLEGLVAGCIQGIGVVRFNPFTKVGSDQSFAVAFVNGSGDGVVITGLYGRDESRLYAKPIEGGRSPYTLMDEEREAIRCAMR